MPQLSLYFDESTLKKVERAAKLSQMSLSQWVRTKLLQSLESDWPENYFSLFGSIKDDSFQEPDELPWASREKL